MNEINYKDIFSIKSSDIVYDRINIFEAKILELKKELQNLKRISIINKRRNWVNSVRCGKRRR